MSTTSSSEKAKAGLELIRVIEQLTREKGFRRKSRTPPSNARSDSPSASTSATRTTSSVTIDRQKGTDHSPRRATRMIDPHAGELGRIAAQAAKQVMIQKIREAESQTPVRPTWSG